MLPHFSLPSPSLLPAPKPCNARAPTFGSSSCNVSDIGPRRRQSPTFALSKPNHPSPRTPATAAPHRPAHETPRPPLDDTPAHLPDTHTLLPHCPTSLIPFTAMFHTVLSALTAFYRTTVVILPLGHHRTLHLHTLPALLLIPYLAQLN